MRASFYAICVIPLLLASGNASGQSLVNNFAKIYILQGAEVFVKTNSVSNHDLIDNAGELTIERDFINNDTANGGNASGIYYVQRDWINNGNFSADQSEVRLYGAGQLITGSRVTVFYNLALTGTGIKTQTINSETSNLLTLNDLELATDAYEMLVSNTSTNAISRTTGFVSSLDAGRLSRNTNSVAVYLFPTGSSLGTPRYRPVNITPALSAGNTYGVRLANVDATSESFDRAVKDAGICEVNPLFYHRIYRTTGADAADLEIHYDPAADGAWQDVAHWQNLPQWGKTNATPSFNLPFSTYVANAWNDFSFAPFALARLAPSVNAGNDTAIIKGASVQLNATVTGVYNSLNWIPSTFLDDASVLNPVSTPDSTITYTITLDEGNPCKADDNITITVIEEQNEIAIPQAFSPNSDGTNDFFLIINPQIVETVDFKIFNRWGQLVFESKDKNFRWDGKFQGEPQDLGVFAWVAELKKIGNLNAEILSGNVTLVK